MGLGCYNDYGEGINNACFFFATSAPKKINNDKLQLEAQEKNDYIQIYGERAQECFYDLTLGFVSPFSREHES